MRCDFAFARSRSSAAVEEQMKPRKLSIIGHRIWFTVHDTHTPTLALRFRHGYGGTRLLFNVDNLGP